MHPRPAGSTPTRGPAYQEWARGTVFLSGHMAVMRSALVLNRLVWAQTPIRFNSGGSE